MEYSLLGILKYILFKNVHFALFNTSIKGNNLISVNEILAISSCDMKHIKHRME